MKQQDQSLLPSILLRFLTTFSEPPGKPTTWPGNVDLSIFSGLATVVHMYHDLHVPWYTKAANVAIFAPEALKRQEKMTSIGGSAGLEDDVFVAQFESCQFPGDQFRHADHLRLAWIYIRKYGCDVAEQRMRQSIQSFARSLGAAHKYHETITFFWMRLVDVDIRSSCPRATFADFVDAHPWLFEKDLVLEFYSRELLMSDAARRAWVEPDRKPIPYRGSKILATGSAT